MLIVQDVFQRCKPNFSNLTAYGFYLLDDKYFYRVDIMDGDFVVEVVIKKACGDVCAKVIDKIDNSEYESINVPALRGKFVNSVRAAYRVVLEELRDQCFIKLPFVHEQSNRLAEKIHERFGDLPEKFMGKNVQAFKVKAHQKWYAVIANIECHKVIPAKKDNQCVEVLNIKVDSTQITALLQQKGYYPAYHMNKKHWVSIILDNTVTDENIMILLEESYKLVSEKDEVKGSRGKKAWIVPANPKYFDVIKAFEEKDSIRWKQAANIATGDLVFLYLGAPYSAVLYHCEVVESNILPDGQQSSRKPKKMMFIKRLAQYDRHQFPFSLLKQYGVNAVRSARGIPDELVEKMLGLR